MQPLEQTLRHRYPHWFRGRRARLAQPVLRGLMRLPRMDAVEQCLQQSGHLRDFEFVSATLAQMQACHLVEGDGLQRIPASGRLLIVANHPSGALDALALLDAVGKVRRDVRIVANDVLSLLQPLAGLLLPVRIFGGKAGARVIRAIEHSLEREECVIVFPAGEMSRWSPRGVCDGRWSTGFVRFARRTRAPVLPVRVQARNSALFYGASSVLPPAGTALLAREMFASRQRPVSLRIGTPMQLDCTAHSARVAEDMRTALYALRSLPAAGPPPEQEPIAPAMPTQAVCTAITQIELLGQTADDNQIRLAQLRAGKPLLLQIGSLREITVRAIGEGSGRGSDLDAFDPDYEHIVLWDAQCARIAGGYRIASGARMLASRGLSGLYTASLFRYADEAIARLAQGMELARSFVVPGDWGSRSLGLPVAGHRRLAESSSARALPVRRRVDQQCAARAAGTRTDRRVLRAASLWRAGRTGLRHAAIRIPSHAGCFRAARCPVRHAAAQAQPACRRCADSGAVQAGCGAVRTRWRALSRLRRGPCLFRCGGWTGGSGPAASAAAETA